MEFEAAPARHEGRLLSKFQRDRCWTRGRLTVREEPDDELHRVVRMARLQRVEGGGLVDVLPPLHDAQLIEFRDDWLTITGYERQSTATAAVPTCYAQSWFLVPLRPHTTP